VLPLPESIAAVGLAVVAARRNCCRWRRLAGRACDVGDDNICGVPVQAAAARSYRIVVLGSAWEAASYTSRNGTPASSASVMNARAAACAG
jgi:hypothetical protein